MSMEFSKLKVKAAKLKLLKSKLTANKKLRRRMTKQKLTLEKHLKMKMATRLPARIWPPVGKTTPRQTALPPGREPAKRCGRGEHVSLPFSWHLLL